MPRVSKHDAAIPAPPPVPESLLAKTGFSALAGSLTVVSRMVATITAARMLGPEQAGHLAYFLWAAETLVLVCGLGLPAATTTFVAELRGQGRFHETALVRRWTYFIYIALAATGGAAGCFVVSRTELGRQLPSIALYFGAYLFLSAIGVYHIAYHAGHQNFRRIARINACSATVLVIAVGIFTQYGGLAGALLSYVAGSIPAALAWIRAPKLEPSLSTETPGMRARLFRYALYAWYGTVMAAFTWSRAEIYFIGRFWGAEEVSMLSVGITLSMVATQGPILLVGALLPQFAQLRGAGQIKEISALFASGTRLMALLLFPSCFGLASITPVLLPLVYGDAFADAVPNAVVLIAFSAVAFSSVSSSLLLGLEKSRVVAWMSTIGAIATTIAGLLIVSKTGAWGAAWSRSVIQASMVGLTMIYIRVRLQVSVPWMELLKTMFAAAGSASISGLLVWRFGTVSAAIGGIPIAVCVYSLLVRQLGILHPDDMQAVTRIIDRLPRPFRVAAATSLHWLVRRKPVNA